MLNFELMFSFSHDQRLFRLGSRQDHGGARDDGRTRSRRGKELTTRKGFRIHGRLLERKGEIRGLCHNDNRGE